VTYTNQPFSRAGDTIEVFTLDALNWLDGTTNFSVATGAGLRANPFFSGVSHASFKTLTIAVPPFARGGGQTQTDIDYSNPLAAEGLTTIRSTWLLLMQVTIGPDREIIYGGYFGWNRINLP
jgi:hypothetical protein